MSARRTLVAGNWKMNLTHLEAIGTIQKLSYALDALARRDVEVSVHPPFTALRSVQTVIDADDLPISLGAQDVHWEARGPWTGEISAAMLAKLNVRYVIVGHSERRVHCGETDAEVARKAAAVVGAGMVPICCVGESAPQRDGGAAHEVVVAQVKAALGVLDPAGLAGVVVAYEPLWAIGTGRAATPEDAAEMCGAIRQALVEVAGSERAGAVRVLYGGSVTPANAVGLLGAPDVDGALVGGASLDPEALAAIAGAAPR